MRVCLPVHVSVKVVVTPRQPTHPPTKMWHKTHTRKVCVRVCVFYLYAVVVFSSLLALSRACATPTHAHGAGNPALVDSTRATPHPFN